MKPGQAGENEIKNILRKYGLRANFTYGQNFLASEEILNEIVKAAEISPTDKILEIGPGIGNLTRKLLETGAFVLSIEKDPKFLPILKSIKKDFKDNFRFEIADALEFDYALYFKTRSVSANKNSDQRITADYAFLSADGNSKTVIPYKVVANIPYYITGKILQMLLSAKTRPLSITVLTQKEVAQNIIAKPGAHSMLSISIQIHGEPKIVKIVPAKSFYPAPKVDSAIVNIKICKEPKYEIGDGKKFFSVLRACFTGKRKQIHNTLKNNLHLEKEKVSQILSSAKIKPAARPQELSIEQWIDLVQTINYSNYSNSPKYPK